MQWKLPSLNRYLPAVVFITGAGLLIVEIVAMRLLSPYFGNTLYSVSSVLSVILAALAAGYFHGGRMADNRGSFRHFFLIIAYSGVTVALLPLLSRAVLPIVSGVFSFSFAYGSLFSAIILFAFPAYLLGLLSPYAVKLYDSVRPEKGIGTIAGSMFFYSTLGSIVGSLSAGFFFIPHVGVTNSLLGVGSVLLLIGLYGVFSNAPPGGGRSSGNVIAMLLIGYVVSFGYLGLPALDLQAGVVQFEKDGQYERIAVVDTLFQGKPARLLVLDRSASSGIFLPEGTLAFPYTEYYQFAHLLKSPPNEMLVVGGGTFTVPRVLRDTFKEANVTAIEIEPELLPLAQEYFGLTDLSRIHPVVADGRQFLRTATTTYDFIFGDAYSSLYSVPWQLTTEEYYRLVGERLSKSGIYVTNFIGNLSKQQPSIIFSTVRTLQKVFPHVAVFAVDTPTSLTAQNIMIVASKERLAWGTANSFVENARMNHEFDLSRVNIEAYPVITDERAPVEEMSARLFRIPENVDSVLLGEEMYSTIEHIVGLGARHPRSAGHQKLQEMIVAELSAYSIPVFRYSFATSTISGGTREMTNILGRINPDATTRIILGTHYDTKRFADLDSRIPEQPVPGANDGASGVAALLELARVLPYSIPPTLGVDLLFFDGEEGDEEIETKGDHSKYLPIGSTEFASNLSNWYPKGKPEFGIILDMVCKKNLKIYPEANSERNAPALQQSLFALGRTLYPQIFQSTVKYTIQDDHVPLANAGVPSMLLIDIEYPYFHTTKDTPDKCSAESLHAVGDTVRQFLEDL